MTFLEPLRVIGKIFQEALREIENQNPTPDQKPSISLEDFIVPMVEGALLGAGAQLLRRSLKVPSYFAPPTLKVCKSLPDLLIGSEADPTGILRNGMDLGLKIALPGFPEIKVCKEIPLSQVEEQLRGVLEFLLPVLGGVPLVRDMLKEAGLIREVKLQRLPSNHHLVQELREHLKTYGVLKEVHFRQLSHDHPDVKRLREQLEKVEHRHP